jgi:hypothetical protein
MERCLRTIHCTNNIMTAEHETLSESWAHTVQDIDCMFQLLSSMHVSLFHILTGSIHATYTIMTAPLQIICAQVYIHFSKLENSTLRLLLLANIIADAVINDNNNNKPMTTNVSVTKA